MRGLRRGGCGLSFVVVGSGRGFLVFVGVVLCV